MLVPSSIALPAVTRKLKIPCEAPGILYSIPETWMTAFSPWSLRCIRAPDGSGLLLQLILETDLQHVTALAQQSYCFWTKFVVPLYPAVLFGAVTSTLCLIAKLIDKEE